jgi:hypothetical protein
MNINILSKTKSNEDNKIKEKSISSSSTSTTTSHINHFENDFNRLKNKPFRPKHMSPVNTFRNNLNINFHPPNFRSPEFMRKPNNLNLNMNMNYTNFGNGGVFLSPNHPFTSLSPSGMTMNMYSQQNIFGGLNSGAPVISSGQGQGSLKNNFKEPPPINNFVHKNNNNPSVNNRRLSENTYDKIKDNPLSNMGGIGIGGGNIMNKTMNMIRSPPVYMKVNPEMIFNFNMNNSYARNLQNSYNNTGNNFNLNNSSVGPIDSNGFIYSHSNTNTNVNNGYASPRGQIPRQIIGNENIVNTIHKKIQNWENMNNQKIVKESKTIENIIPTKNSQPVITNNTNNDVQDECEGQLIPVSQNIQNTNLQIFTSHYEGLCNFLIFLRSCTPYVLKRDSNLIVKKYFINI